MRLGFARLGGLLGRRRFVWPGFVLGAHLSTLPSGGRGPGGGGPGSPSGGVDVSVPPTRSRRGADRNTPPPLRPVAVTRGPAAPPASRSTRLLLGLRKTGKVCFYTFVPLLMLVIIAVGILYVRLRHGPISFDFLTAPVVRGINAEMTKNRVTIAGSEVGFGRDGNLELRLRDLTVVEPDGAVVISAPQSAINISLAGLLSGRVVPARIVLIDPVITLAYKPDQGLVFDQTADLPVPGEPGPAQIRPDASARPSEVNIAKALTDASFRARRGLDASHYLTEFGLSNATLVILSGEGSHSWNIPEASIDFNHGKRRSVISGRASVTSPSNAWALSFITDESEKSGRLLVNVTLRDLVPASLADAAPPMALLRVFQMPLAGDATVELSKDGNVVSTDLALELGAGRITHPDLTKPIELSAGLFKLNYDGASRRWDLQPSPMKWPDGSLLFQGSMKDVAQAGQDSQWQFELEGKNAVFEAPQFNVPPVALDVWRATGDFVPKFGRVNVEEFKLSGGGADVTAKAVFEAGPDGDSARADVTISPMPLATLKALWPSSLAPGARGWVGENVDAVDFKGGTLHYVNGGYIKSEPDADARASHARELVSASFEVADATFRPLDDMSPIKAPRALIQIHNNALEAIVPEGFVDLGDGRTVPLKSGRLYSPDVLPKRSDGEITFTTSSPLSAFLDAVEQLPVRAVREAGPLPDAGEGKVDADFKINLPLVTGLNVDDIQIQGKAKITDGRFGKVAGKFDVQGFSLDVDVSQTQLDAKGDLIVNGVPAKIVGQRVFSQPFDQQPPLRITANLDDSDRTQLGFDINDMVRGVVPVDISLQRSAGPQPVIKLNADLTAAEVVLGDAWTKSAGRKAALETDIVTNGSNKTELQNFKVSGDDIAARGAITIGDGNKATEFNFPNVTLNVISQLAVRGTRGKDDIWKIDLNSPTYDGRSFFKSLFSVGDGDNRKARASGSAGADVTASIGNLIGSSDVSMRSVKVKLSKRDDKLTALDAKGTLDGGAAFAARSDTSSSVRRILADSSDAGQLLKMLDFYSSMQGGRLRLELNLDGKDAADKTGILWIDNFKVLGDPVVSEVVASADGKRAKIEGNKNVKREVFEFFQMRAPFSAGYGQFVLDDAYLKGPLVGASVRGKLDFKLRRVNVGGTYIPLQGLNSAFAPIPLLGQLISGTQGEGIFGITFAVQGPMSNPQVIVNPLSMVAPGIFRDIFQMAPYKPKVQRRDSSAAGQPVEQRVRSSSATSGTAGKASKRKGPSDTVDGWSSTTTND